MFRQFVQLDQNGTVVAELESALAPTGASIVEVTGRTDGPFGGKTFDKATNSFGTPLDNRQEAHLLIFDAQDKSRAPRYDWPTGQPMSLEVTLKDAAGNVATAVNGDFDLLLVRFDPVNQRFAGASRRIRLTFTAGVAARGFGGFAESGDYLFDSQLGDVAKFATTPIIKVWE